MRNAYIRCDEYYGKSMRPDEGEAVSLEQLSVAKYLVENNIVGPGRARLDSCPIKSK